MAKLRPRGGYRDTASFQTATIVYDATWWFCEKFLEDRSDRSDPTDQTGRIPPCPKCRKPMVLRTAHKGRNAGRQFWGCSAYPDCKGVVEN